MLWPFSRGDWQGAYFVYWITCQIAQGPQENVFETPWFGIDSHIKDMLFVVVVVSWLIGNYLK